MVRKAMMWCVRVLIMCVCVWCAMHMYVWATTSTWAWAPLVSVLPTIVCGVVALGAMCAHDTTGTRR